MKTPHARPDFKRHERQGFPEAVYCASKTLEQVLAIAAAYASRREPALLTRLDPAAARSLRRRHGRRFEYHAVARMGILRPAPARTPQSEVPVLVVTAGTSDVPVAEEAALTVEHILGRRVHRLYDVGVAGLHRLLEHQPLLRTARCVIVCAGMEGALPSVVGGLAPCPVIAVPTSVGYGVSAGGFAALNAMLSACASNVSVVNIDNGFSAGVIASLIARSAR
jgi:NCAIR mutase (PurE)-related protein